MIWHDLYNTVLWYMYFMCNTVWTRIETDLNIRKAGYERNIQNVNTFWFPGRKRKDKESPDISLHNQFLSPVNNIVYTAIILYYDIVGYSLYSVIFCNRK